MEYQWDNTQSENERVHNFSKLVNACEAHRRINPLSTRADDMDREKKIYDTVLEENQRKNQALAKVLELRPELCDITDNATGQRYDLMKVAKDLGVKDANPIKKVTEMLQTGTTLKQNINYVWRWVESENRVNRTGNPVPRTLEIDFETPQPSVQEMIELKQQIPDANNEQIKQEIKKRVVGEPDKLQEALDQEFSKEKKRGRVIVKGA